jgi:hypothetical protein
MINAKFCNRENRSKSKLGAEDKTLFDSEKEVINLCIVPDRLTTFGCSQNRTNKI